MRDGGGVNFYGFSSRHIRLKYQAVSASVVAAMIPTLAIESVSIPGFINFSETPPVWLIQVGVILFGVFSLVAFHFQTRIERKHIPLTGMHFRNEIQRQSQDLVSKARSLTGDAFQTYQKTIVEELSSLPPASYDDLSSAVRWQPIAKHFYDIQTAANFAQMQLESHRKAVTDEIYQGSSSFDVHYSNTVNMLAAKIETLINSIWRPNDLRKTIGDIQYSSNVIEDMKHLNSIAENLLVQHKYIQDDLNEYVKLKNLNQEMLSVQVPYGLSIGLLTFSIGSTLAKFFGCNL